MLHWKRADITQALVLRHFALPSEARRPADELIAAQLGAPIKVVEAALERECRADTIECASHPRNGWLTEKGVAILAAIDRPGIQPLEQAEIKTILYEYLRNGGPLVIPTQRGEAE